jgi:hypothetical protein
MNATFTNKEASFTQTPIPYPKLSSVTGRLESMIKNIFEAVVAAVNGASTMALS